MKTILARERVTAETCHHTTKGLQCRHNLMTILGIVSYYIDTSEGCLTHSDHIMIAYYE